MKKKPFIKKKIKLDLSKKKIIEEPLKALKKLNLGKFKKFTNISLKETLINYKKKQKQKELDKINLLKKEKIKEAKKEKLEQKRQKLNETEIKEKIAELS